MISLKNLKQQITGLNVERDSLQSELKNCLDYSRSNLLKVKIELNNRQRIVVLRELENVDQKKKFGFSGSKIVCRSSQRKGPWNFNS